MNTMLPSGVVLLGGGGHAHEVIGLIEDLDRLTDQSIEVVAIADDRWDNPERFRSYAVHKVLGLEKSFPLADRFIAAVGYPAGRRSVAERAEAAGLVPCEALIHPRANVATRITVGAGSVVLALASIQGGVRVGRHCHVSHGVLIGHDTDLGDFTSVMPGAAISGDVRVGSGVLIGTGASVIEGLAIGDRAVVGAGAVVIRDVAPDTRVVGVPARSTRSRS